MGKIAIVGVEGSGKTVLMAALTECYQKISDTEPYLMPENHSAFLFMQQVPHKLRVAREWPGATGIDSLRTMKWTLRCGKEIVQEIEMLDYPGELYRHAFGERKPAEVAAHRAELDEFLGHLTDAEMLVVLFNLEDLEDLGTNARNVEAVWITKGIFDFAEKLPNLKRQLLVFTQADRYAAMLKAHGGAQGLYAAKMPMLKVLHPDLSVTAIAAVDGTDADGRPKEDYSSAACHELMRLILQEADDLAQTYLQDCEKWADELENFSNDSVLVFQSKCNAYERAFNNLSESAQPLSYAYRCELDAHSKKLALFTELSEQAHAICQDAENAAVANPAPWIALRVRFPTYQTQIAAFHRYYARMLEDEQRRKHVAAKNERCQMRTMAIVFGCIISVVTLVIVLVVYHNHQEALKSRYYTVQSTYETQVAAHRELLETYGGEKWKAVEEAARYAYSYTTDPKRGEAWFSSALRSLDDVLPEARTAKLKDMIAKARRAKIAGSWRICLESANQTLALQANHAEALALQREAVQNSALVVALGAGINLTFCWCPAGSYTRGSSYGETGRGYDESEKTVTLTKGFWMGKYEVTQAQWEAVMGNNPTSYENTRFNAPVESVSWNDCQGFIRKMNARVPGGGFRLPTEAEWEYTCRAGTTTALNNKKSLTQPSGRCSNLDEVAWYDENSGKMTHPVGQKKPNAWGLYDMHGNVAEWCQDWYENYPTGCMPDPAGPTSGSYRVIRGGSWYNNAGQCRSAQRSAFAPENRYTNIGLRLVRDAP